MVATPAWQCRTILRDSCTCFGAAPAWQCNQEHRLTTQRLTNMTTRTGTQKHTSTCTQSRDTPHDLDHHTTPAFVHAHTQTVKHPTQSPDTQLDTHIQKHYIFASETNKSKKICNCCCLWQDVSIVKPHMPMVTARPITRKDKYHSAAQ